MLSLVSDDEGTEGARTVASNLQSMSLPGLPELFKKESKKRKCSKFSLLFRVSSLDKTIPAEKRENQQNKNLKNNLFASISLLCGLDPELRFLGGLKCLISLTSQGDIKYLGINIDSQTAHLNPTCKDSNNYIGVLKSYLFAKTSFWAFK